MKRIIALGIVIILVIALWTGAWFVGASVITGYAKSLETADGVNTPKVVCGSLGVGGYPFGFDATCVNATVTLADTTVTTAGVQASVMIYNPTHVLVAAKSPVSIADAFTGSQSRVDFASLEGSARLTGWRIGRVSLVVEKPVWNDSVLEDRLIAKADHVEAHLIDLPDQYDAKAHLAALGEYFEVNNLNAPGFQINAGKSTFQGDLTGLPDDVRAYGDADLIKRWQAAGGKFTLTDFKGEDGDTNFDATGTAQLDAQGRVNGQLKLNSKGVVERLGTAISDQYKGLIVGGQAADGSYSQTVNIAAGLMFVGLVPAGMIPPVF